MEKREGPPPGKPMHGINALTKGEENLWTVDLAPGSHGLICFVPDAMDGEPHFVHGMLHEFEVN